MKSPRDKIEPLGKMPTPPFSGIRVMMMPFKLDDLDTVPFEGWRPALRAIIAAVNDPPYGVGYLTIDEALVKSGETHRRPGLHIDGMGSYGGPAPYAYGGMVLLASHFGCVGYKQPLPFDELAQGVRVTRPVGEEGDCEHLRSTLDQSTRIEMQPGEAYWCSPYAMHEAVPQPRDVQRQLLRLSMPNSCPWHDCYTPSPFGVKPSGPIVKGRENFMAFRK